MERGEAQRKPFAEALNGRLSENYAGDTYTQIKKDNRGLEARPSVFYFSSFNLFSYTSTFSTRFPSPAPSLPSQPHHTPSAPATGCNLQFRSNLSGSG